MGLWENLRGWGQVLGGPSPWQDIRYVAGQTVEDIGSRLGIPEMGISERIAGGPTQRTQRQAYAGPPAVQYQTPEEQAQLKAWDAAQRGGGGVAPTAAPTPTGGEQPGYYVEAPAEAGPDWEAMARSGYESLMGGLESIESAYRSEYPVTQKEITTGYEQAKPELEAARTEQLGELGERRISEMGREKGAIASARRLYNELRQQRMAELSARGLTASSVAEAQMERLGREAYRDIGGARKAAADTYRQIETEETKVGEFYSRKLQELETNKAMAIEKARVAFNQGLAEIQAMKGKAGAEYQMQQAQMRYDAMQKLRQESLQIQEYNSRMRLQLEQWAVEKQESLAAAKQKVAGAITSPEYSRQYLETARGYGLEPTKMQVTGGKAPTYYFGKPGEEETLPEEEETLFKE